MPMKHPNFLEIKLGGETLRCSYDYSPGTPSTMYRSNGDPGDEGDPEEFEVTKVELLALVATAFAPAIWRDITDLLDDLDVGEKIDELARAEFDTLAEAADEPPPDQGHERD